MPTPHNKAQKGDIAATVLMPGDPLRAKWIAETYLTDVRLVSDVRNIYCFTGRYKGCDVSVMASGMGMPSIGIYSYELYKDYDVQSIIRIGSAGAYTDRIRVMDVVLAEKAYSESSYGKAQNLDDSPVRYPSKTLNDCILACAAASGRRLVTGPIHSSDIFYREPAANDSLQAEIARESLLCVEMESYALFHNAAVLGRQAACLLTISDSLVTGESLSADDRATAFSDMVLLALDTAAALAAGKDM